MVEFYLPLYYKPGPEMDIEGKENFDLQILIEHGKFLKENLEKAAKLLKILRENGWNYYGALYDIVCYKDISLEEAKRELKKLKIDIDLESLEEVEEELE